eukprot:11167378-Lingulodinium_polyedra.AAC.1
MCGRWSGGGRAMVGRWPGDGRAMVGQWTGDGRAMFSVKNRFLSSLSDYATNPSLPEAQRAPMTQGSSVF